MRRARQRGVTAQTHQQVHGFDESIKNKQALNQMCQVTGKDKITS